MNDIVEETNSYMNLGTDDAKLLKTVKSEEDCDMLQKNLNRIRVWSQKWEMKFNVDKCEVMKFEDDNKTTIGNYQLGN